MERLGKELNDILISIVIVSYNCAEVITENIYSCLGSEISEIIVVDNASYDQSVSIIQSFESEKIKLIINPENEGFTRACNQGIKRAKGKFIMLLNPDAILQIDCLENLIAYLKVNPDIGIVAPCLYFPDGTFQNYTRTFPTVLSLWVESFVPMKYWNVFKSYRKYTCQDIDFTKEQTVEQPAGAALMFRNQWIMDENYFIYGSDVDLCKTVSDAGYKIVQIPTAKVFHHQSKGGTEAPKLRMYLDLDNYFGMNYYFRKHNQTIDAVFYRVVFSFSLLFRAFFAILEGNEKFLIRWKKFKFFLQSKNFKSIHDI
jgi:GT2 family glycosyltransferase